tara:strand:+ start:4983 stop:5783 length:801 start_codon:yes stop_codon:yes gene_type:complete
LTLVSLPNKIFIILLKEYKLPNPIDPNKRYYFRKLDLLERKKFFKKLKIKKGSLSLWSKGYDESDLENFSITKVSDNESTLFLEKKSKFLKKFFRSLLSDSDVLVKVTEGRKFYFFEAHLKHKNKNQYELTSSEDIYVSQQRKNYRLSSGAFVKIKVQVDNKLFSGSDISAGGCAFIIPKELEEIFDMTSLLSSLKVSLNRQIFEVPKARITKKTDVILKEVPDKEFFKVSIEFLKLPKATEEELRRVINNEARGLEIRHKFNLKS